MRAEGQSGAGPANQIEYRSHRYYGRDREVDSRNDVTERKRLGLLWASAWWQDEDGNRCRAAEGTHDSCVPPPASRSVVLTNHEQPRLHELPIRRDNRGRVPAIRGSSHLYALTLCRVY